MTVSWGSLPVHIGDDDLGAFARKPQRGRPPESLTGPRDNRDFSLQSTHLALPPCLDSLGPKPSAAVSGRQLERVADKQDAHVELRLLLVVKFK